MLNFRARIQRLIRELRQFGEAEQFPWEQAGVLRDQLRAYKASLKSGRITGKFRRTAIVGRERFARRKITEILKKERRGIRVSLPRAVMCRKYIPSEILDKIYDDRKDKWVPIVKRDRTVLAEVSLENFNIIDDPDKFLSDIFSIADVEARYVSARLNFLDRHCVDIAPYLVMAEFWPSMARVFRGGKMQIPLQKAIDAVDLRRPLGMRLVVEDNTDIWAFPLRRRRATGSSRDPFRNLAPQVAEKVGDEFCDAVSDWLGNAGDLELSLNGRVKFTSIIGELLNNAERHSDIINRDGSWSIVAFMARRKEGTQIIFRCYMAFLSVGSSIAESLSTSPPETLADIRAYSARHSRAGISTDTLATVIALQDGVTRDPVAARQGRGGIGLQDVMEFVRVIGATKDPAFSPRMTIVSGQSCIKLRAPYLAGIRSEGDERRQLWFNPTNSPEVAPDRNFVFDLQRRFPGTVVSLSFTLDPEYLSEVIHANDRPSGTDKGRGA